MGNSSLQGAKELLVKGRCEAAAVLAQKAEEVELSVHPVFQQAYMDAMFFSSENNVFFEKHSMIFLQKMDMQKKECYNNSQGLNRNPSVCGGLIRLTFII